MFLRPHFRRRNGNREAYWALVESYRTERGPRQRTVAYLGLMDEAGRLGVEQAAEPQLASPQRGLFPEGHTEPRFVEIDRTRVRVENCRQFGGPWLALEFVKRLGLPEFLKRTMPTGQEHVPWSLTALILVIARLCEPSSELHIAEHFYRQSALCDLLGVPVDKVDDNRLYRGLDELLPHKRALEVFLKQRFGELFAIEYDLLLVRRDQHVLRGAGQRQSLGEAWLLARPSSGLQASLHRPGGDALRLAVGLRSLRGKPARLDDLGRDRRDDGGPLWPGTTHLGTGSRDGLGRQPRLPESRASGSTSWGRPRASSSDSNSSWRRRTGTPSARDWRSSCVRAPTAAAKPTFFVAAAIVARKSRRCTRGSRNASKRD